MQKQRERLAKTTFVVRYRVFPETSAKKQEKTLGEKILELKEMNPIPTMKEILTKQLEKTPLEFKELGELLTTTVLNAGANPQDLGSATDDDEEEPSTSGDDSDMTNISSASDDETERRAGPATFTRRSTHRAPDSDRDQENKQPSLLIIKKPEATNSEIIHISDEDDTPHKSSSSEKLQRATKSEDLCGNPEHLCYLESEGLLVSLNR